MGIIFWPVSIINIVHDTIFIFKLFKLNRHSRLNESRDHLQKYDLSLRALCELGKLYKDLYEIKGNEEDLISGVTFYERAKNLMGEFHPDRPAILNSLGNLLLEQFIIERNPLFLEKAIENFQKAEEFYKNTLAFETINRNVRPIVLNGLGNALRERHAVTGNRVDLNNATLIYEKAFRLAMLCCINLLKSICIGAYQ